MNTTPDTSDAAAAAALRAILAGLCASLVGIGLARFAYTPLIPPLIQAHWFAAGDVVFLGAANLLGYLAGALAARPVAARFGARRALQWMMAAVALAFFACALPLSVAWFFGWRFLSGFAGGIIMVLAALTVLPRVPAQRRGLASGAIFLGIGLGIAASGTLVPVLLQRGLAATWTGLGVLSLVLTLASWRWWPQALPGAGAGAPSAPASAVPEHAAFALKLIYAQYALQAIGLVPLMVFLVDYAARGLHMDTHAAALFWVVYGVGAIVGPVAYGMLGDRLGVGNANRATLALQLAAIGALAASPHMAILMAATFVVGTFPTGIVPLALSRIRSALQHHEAAQAAAWSRATTVSALAQALAAYGCAWIFAATGGQHRVAFAVGAGALAVALVSDLLFARGARTVLAPSGS